MDAYEKLVFSICYKITGDYFTAEDLAQETFLTVYQKYETFDGQNEKAWICRIATNKSIDYIRSAGQRMVPTQDAFFELITEKKENPEELCIEQEIKNNLTKYCDELKPPYDEIAREYYLEEMTAAQIAKKKQMNVKSVQTQIYRARSMLQKLYGKEEGR
ncbi:MAG: sigma-70 family RNA polymerase sigma factor [Lachnospiraceae bacterium]|nr:sigma-70 family RNA polymerase sigma factor [Lachnospiraceae bacterium]MBQ8877148.1 sigma-70 family RNA polymerase sigma factor [Lachnospiraceae bacterium]